MYEFANQDLHGRGGKIGIFGPLRVNHYFAFVDAANIDKDNGQYYQIGIIKYAFLD
jgi:hypothetical protein